MVIVLGIAESYTIVYIICVCVTCNMESMYKITYYTNKGSYWHDEVCLSLTSFFFSSSRYAHLRMLDRPGMEEIMPLTPEAFLEHIKNTTKQTREILMNDWLEECADMIDDERDEIERWMPENQVSVVV